MDEGCFNLSELTEKVRSYLEECLPDMVWDKHYKGASIPSMLTGTVSAGAMEFEDTVKGADIAIVTFFIYLIDPTSTNGVDEIAMRVRQVLMDNDTLDDTVQHGAISKIEFGAVTGKAGACLLTYKVKLWM